MPIERRASLFQKTSAFLSSFSICVIFAPARACKKSERRDAALLFLPPARSFPAGRDDDVTARVGFRR